MKYSRLQRQTSRFLTPILTAIALCLLGYLVIYKLGFLNITNVQVVGAKTFVSESDLLEVAKARSYGKSLVYIDTKDLEKSLRENFLGAKDIRVSKSFPSTLLIHVEERTPIAIVYNNNSEGQFLLDENGYVLGLIAPETSNLPKIYYDGEIAVGYFLDEKAFAVYFDLLRALDKEQLAVSSVSVHSDFILVYLRSSIEALIDVRKDVYASVNTLAQLIRQLTTEGKSPKKVDLRFEKVVVSYN